MIEMIENFRSSPERTHIKLGFMSCIKVTNGQRGKIAKNMAFGGYTGSKRGCYICKKEMDMLLCDIVAAMGLAVVGALAIVKLVSARSDKKMCCDGDECKE